MKIGILGVGSIGMRHAVNLSEMGHKTACYDPLSYNKPEWRKDALDSDAIVIASPSKCHLHDLYDCIEAGKPIFVEKPIATNDPDTLEIYLKKAKAPIAVGYNLRFAEPVIWAWDQIQQGAIGRPYWAGIVVAQHSSKKPYLEDGVILNWSHEIDVAQYLLGTAKLISCVKRGSPEVMADIMLEHLVDQTVSTVHLDYHGDPELRGGTILGEKGNLIYDLVRRGGYVQERGSKVPGIKIFGDTWDQNYKDEMKAFIHLVKTGEYGRLCRGWDGLSTMKICLEARK